VIWSELRWCNKKYG